MLDREELVATLRGRDGDDCALCGKPLGDSVVEVDHIRPLRRGGHPTDLANLQLAHRSCNKSKGHSWDGHSGIAAPDDRMDLAVLRIHKTVHRRLKSMSAARGVTMRTLVENVVERMWREDPYWHPK